jgi:hypothetical protein
VRYLCDMRMTEGNPREGQSSSNCARLYAALAVCCVAVGALAISAAPASAYTPRTYEGQLKPPHELTFLEGIAVDSAKHVWVSDNLSQLIYEFNAEDEQLPTEISQYSSRVYSIAADYENNYLYEANNFGDTIEAYSPTGALINSFSTAEGQLALAVDNSSEPTAGAIYLSHGLTGEGVGSKTVEAVSEDGEPVAFKATATYISGNALTGTPTAPFANPTSLATGPSGEIYVVDSGKVDEFESSGEFNRQMSPGEGGIPIEFNPRYIAVDPTTGDLLATSEKAIDEFSPAGTYLGQITGSEVEGEFAPGQIAVSSDGFLYAISSPGPAFTASHGRVDIFSPSFPLPKITSSGVSNGAESSPTEASVDLNAEISPDGGGNVESCEFEYVKATKYEPTAANPFEAGQTIPCSQPPPYSGLTHASAEASGLSPDTAYRYRVLASNENGVAKALPRNFQLQAPTVTGLSSSNLTETTADLSAKVNPEGGETTCRFEYGTSTSYGQIVPCPAIEGLGEGDIGSVEAEQVIHAHLENLEKGVVYHFRLVAENPFGTTTTEDQSFNFFPPKCPNLQVRQQTGTNFLPDCRAYELVSPPDAGGTILLPQGPQSSVATDPSRFAFGGILGKIPGSGGDPPDELGDLYVATRTDAGWTTRYIGLPASQSLVDNGPPNQDPWIEYTPSGELTDLSMDQFMNWSDPYNGFYGGSHQPPGSYAPYLWSFDGNSLGRLPTNLGVVAGGEQRGEQLIGAMKPSPEFNHYFFSSNGEVSFAEGSLGHEPGSAYDDSLEENTVSLISKLPNGSPIEEGGGEYITFPGVSTDGSHVLMSTGYSCNYACDPNYDFAGVNYYERHHVEAERHLFMRVGGGPGGVTYPIAPGHAVQYVGINSDGTKVYFMSNEPLTPEAEDTSSNLYMWSEEGEEKGHPLILISKPNGSSGTGTPVCPSTTWTSECGAVPFITGPELFLPDSIQNAGPGGDGLSDNAIAADNGDIYFYSPAQLDGGKGVVGQQNLYDYREGNVQYVTTFTTGQFCEKSDNCSQGPMVRIQVSPDDSHMAFLTASKITSYENAGYLEMYTYEAATGKITCVSCLPTGAPPTSNVEASDNGLFMTNDGRAFFSTADALVPQDTDGIRDVYEYVEGRPQLISAGTGSREVGITIAASGLSEVGLIGVSANGTDAYFSTYDTLVGRDRNGAALKFYDARTDGGFSELPPAAPCAAADECAGPGSSSAPPSQNGTGAELTGGNYEPNNQPAGKHKKRHKHKRKRHKDRRPDRHHHRHHTRHGGGK